MEVSAILVGMAIMILTAVFVFSPFQRTHAQEALGNVSEAVNAETHKRETLAALRDLDFDFQTGKVALEDYTPLRARLLAQAADLMEAMDREEDKVEALIQDRRQIRENQGSASQPQHDPTGEQGRFCPYCGASTVPGGSYCSRCGERLAEVGEAKNLTKGE